MACNKFEEAGLLYVSGELPSDERKAYEAHMVSCAECREEMERYSVDRGTLFTAGMLEEQTPEELDQEIIRICTKPKTMTTGAGLFWSLTRKAIAPVFFLALGLGGGVYIAYNIQQQNGQPVEYAAPAHPETQPEKQADKTPTIQTAKADSITNGDQQKDSSEAGTRPPRGNGTMEGVVPVDLQR